MQVDGIGQRVNPVLPFPPFLSAPFARYPENILFSNYRDLGFYLGCGTDNVSRESLLVEI